MSDETPKDPQELMEYLQQLQSVLDTMNRKLQNLEKRLRPLEKQADLKRRKQRQWEK